jgi:hypothetical protein
MRCCHALI